MLEGEEIISGEKRFLETRRSRWQCTTGSLKSQLLLMVRR